MLAPILTLIQETQTGADWARYRLGDIEPLSASGAQSLVCIRESTRQTTTYGSAKIPGYTYDWQVRVVRLADGKVIGEKRLTGGMPPIIIVGDRPGYGGPPRSNLIEWLASWLSESVAMTLVHPASVYAVAFSPDGTTLTSADAEGKVRLWNVASGKIVQTLDADEYQAHCVAFSPDGKILASAGSDGTVKLWNPVDSKLIRTLDARMNSVRSVAFSPDSQKIVSGSYDGKVRLWDVATGQVLQTMTGHAKEVWSVAFSPDGKFIASSSAEKQVRLWDATTGQLAQTLTVYRLTGEPMQFYVAFSPDSKMIATAGFPNLQFWDVTTGKEIKPPQLYTISMPERVTFSPDGKILANTSTTKIKLIDVTTGMIVRTLTGHTGVVYGIAFSPNGKTLASAGQDKTVRIWNLTTGQ